MCCVEGRISKRDMIINDDNTDVLLLFIDMAYLEPDVSMCQGRRRVAKDAIEAFEGFVVFSLLLINDAEPEEDFICLVEVFVHLKDACEGFFGMVEGAIAVVEDAYSIPEFWIFLWVWEEVQGLLVSAVGFLQIVLHEIAVAYL